MLSRVRTKGKRLFLSAKLWR